MIHTKSPSLDSVNQRKHLDIMQIVDVGNIHSEYAALNLDGFEISNRKSEWVCCRVVDIDIDIATATVATLWLLLLLFLRIMDVIKWILSQDFIEQRWNSLKQ